VDKKREVIFEALTEVMIEVEVFRVVTPCCVVL
jgi:hypothetical protein